LRIIACIEDPVVIAEILEHTRIRLWLVRVERLLPWIAFQKPQPRHLGLSSSHMLQRLFFVVAFGAQAYNRAGIDKKREGAKRSLSPTESASYQNST